MPRAFVETNNPSKADQAICSCSRCWDLTPSQNFYNPLGRTQLAEHVYCGHEVRYLEEILDED